MKMLKSVIRNALKVIAGIAAIVWLIANPFTGQGALIFMCATSVGILCLVLYNALDDDEPEAEQPDPNS
ncbi:MAG: hypothetical protein JWO20_2971 [Candidatus Angelobacter sp.]|jgi:hypothetical protein|nr:hypothetical protein [Candidatus Angelobacter sp.]